ncbi:unnamed protein product [Spirodela intermedia]|uniref:CG-1 domain-containing protein n=1 Tax=Spirodela intermedia TaxID=51605 RepID=A0A7I8ILL5_SPIIN|nr:unnamed protein product [Spirodela intermedia]CAA6658826.1 unnamed protein product [Spirodela intermedia]
MTNSSRYDFLIMPTTGLYIEQILVEAQHRWLRPAEICEILRNYRNFRIAPSGSLFLFDRKVLRYFRRDGHNWRKKKDGKTVKEAHERLKVGSVDVLHCYYAHGEESENFQRRSYWLLEEDFMHIVLVHYREVQGGKASFGRNRDSDESSQSALMETPVSSNSLSNPNQMRSQITDVESLGSAHASEFEDAESDNYQASSRYHPYTESQESEKPVIDASILNPYFPVPYSNTEGCYPGASSGSNYLPVTPEGMTRVFNGLGSGFGSQTPDDLSSWDKVLEHCTTAFPTVSFPATTTTFTEPYHVEGSVDREPSRLGETAVYADDLNKDVIGSSKFDENCQVPSYEASSVLKSNVDAKSAPSKAGCGKYSLLKQLSMEISSSENDGGLRKCDSFCRWMSKELGEVDDSQMQMNSAHYWSPVEGENALFSIIDFSPHWGYAGLETKILVTGSFLTDKIDVDKCKWSCMFGEVEVPAQIVADGVLRCHAPLHKPGRVHFYVTCSNRLACSEIREFEYRVSCPQYMEISDSYGALQLLSIEFDDIQKSVSGLSGAKLHLSSKVSSLLRENDDDWSSILNPPSNKEFHSGKASDQFLEKLLKPKLRAWLLYKIADEGKGPNVLDEEGQGVLHLASALGYDWAIAPTVAAGVSIDFRDVHGWTALHWAASCGRERTVVSLFTLDAAPGALTDPTPKFPSGRTPADLASVNGHKGSLDMGTSSVTEASSLEAFEDVARTAAQTIDRNMQAGLSAIRKAAQAHARIHQAFRIDSFHRKKLSELADDKFGMSDEDALSHVSIKTNKSGPSDEPVAAAIRIQNKFRGWKGRKEFLITRQRIIKIQAHVRGHLVRKHNANDILWSVGIVEKIILRWRRKGSGLRGFRSQGLPDGPGTHDRTTQQDDHDFLKEGRRQTEARLEKALARVKSMVQYPDARDQYQRLLTVAEEFQESKALIEKVLNDPGDGEGDMMFDELLGDENLS